MNPKFNRRTYIVCDGSSCTMIRELECVWHGCFPSYECGIARVCHYCQKKDTKNIDTNDISAKMTTGLRI